MKKIIVVVLSVVFTFGSTSAFSGGGGEGKHGGRHDAKEAKHGGRFDGLIVMRNDKDPFKSSYDWKKCDDKDVRAVPELNASNASLALALVVGVGLVLRERRRYNVV